MTVKPALTTVDLVGVKIGSALRIVASALQAGAGASSSGAMLDARVLLGRALNFDATQLIIEANRTLNAEQAKLTVSFIERRLAGEPIAYITGEKEFYSLNFCTAPGVLVPRPDSETLIDAALEHRPVEAPLRILDLGVGTGCLLITLLRKFKNAYGIGVDRNLHALALTQKNARHLLVDGRLSVVASDWTEAVDGTFDLIISNPPYISEDEYKELAVDIRDYEHPGALVGGKDGLDAYRAIVDALSGYLAKDGLLILELGQGQDAAVKAMVEKVWGHGKVTTASDLAGVVRALVLDLKEV